MKHRLTFYYPERRHLRLREEIATLPSASREAAKAKPEFITLKWLRHLHKFDLCRKK